MKIEIAIHSGFCMGVRKAILRIIQELNHSREDLLVYGPLIHNPQTVSILSKRGLLIEEEIDSMEGHQVAIRTHGIPIDETRAIQARATRVINLTCPRVARVQSLIRKYSREGYYSLIVGDPEHAEVIGLQSFADTGALVLKDINDVEKIPDREKYLLIAQTTLDRELFRRVCERVLEQGHDVKIMDTICDSTRNRQQDVITSIENGSVDTLIVVGGYNSSNTRRLAEIGRNHGIHTLHVETEEEIDDSDLSESEHILLTAGASTPGWIINNVLEKLYAIKQRKSLGGLQHILSIIGVAVRANIFSSIAAGMMTHLLDRIIPVSLGPGFPLLSMAFIFFMYSINNYLDRHILKISNRYKYEVFNLYGYTLILLALLALGYALDFMKNDSPTARLVFLFALFFGTLYSTGMIRRTVTSIGLVPLSKIYFSKIITGFGWLMIIWLLPLLSVYPLLYSKYLIPAVALGLLLFSLVFIRHLLTDLIAYQGDLIMGRDTLPIILGREKSFTVFMVFTLLGILSAMILALSMGDATWAFLALPFLYNGGLIVFIRRKTYLVSLKFETLVDMAFLLVCLGGFVIICF